MSFRIRGLSPAPFAPLFALDDQALAARQARRMYADEPGTAPCRVSLVDAEPGEELLLISHAHQQADSPFRAAGPIFVRRAAHAPFDAVDEIPPAVARRVISARAYDRGAMMLEGELVDGAALKPLLDDWLARPQIETVHLHYARRGCFAAIAERA